MLSGCRHAPSPPPATGGGKGEAVQRPTANVSYGRRLRAGVRLPTSGDPTPWARRGGSPGGGMARDEGGGSKRGHCTSGRSPEGAATHLHERGGVGGEGGVQGNVQPMCAMYHIIPYAICHNTRYTVQTVPQGTHRRAWRRVAAAARLAHAAACAAGRLGQRRQQATGNGTTRRASGELEPPSADAAAVSGAPQALRC
eukprot:scaffold24495_cov111-Isochrysis_galbana.AAC.5